MQVFFFVVRFAGTVLGLLRKLFSLVQYLLSSYLRVVTLAGWYIGAGRGSGHVYTAVVVTVSSRSYEYYTKGG